jgi:hypothetical protein
MAGITSKTVILKSTGYNLRSLGRGLCFVRLNQRLAEINGVSMARHIRLGAFGTISIFFLAQRKLFPSSASAPSVNIAARAYAIRRSSRR